MKKLVLVSCMLLSCSVVFAQDAKTKKDNKKDNKSSVAKTEGGFTKLPSGLEYRIVTDAPGGRKPAEADHVQMHIHLKMGDSVMFDSRKMNNNEPVSFQLQSAKFAGDPAEGFFLLTPGDSAVFRTPSDSLKKAGLQIPEFVKPTDNVEYAVVLVSVKSDQEVKEESEKKSAALVEIEDKQLQEYFAKNNIKATKTASGLYYKVDAPGDGDVIKNGQTAQVMYRGTLLNGTEFDANMGANAKHTDPLPVQVGQGRVIKGWDEGLALLKKGSKATFYIPSRLAYGERSAGASIPPNSILVFDVEIKDVK